MTKKRNVFYSYYHKDQTDLERMMENVSSASYSNVANHYINERNMVKSDNPNIIERGLTKKMQPTNVQVVLIGKDTHKRPWVNWEIKHAHEKGKRIVGVYKHGEKDAKLPKNFDKYASALVGNNKNKVRESINGTDHWNPGRNDLSANQRTTFSRVC